jgi:two-component system, OmpR family, KDP operon response regulator KdpE
MSDLYDAMRYEGTRGSVLVVDDDPSFCRLVDASLRSEGYDVTSAPHGAAALRVAARQDIDLILLDLAMPVMDGREFATAYRRLPAPHAPIVLVTGVVQPPELEREAAALRTSAYVAKPLDIDTLLETTRRFVPAPARRGARPQVSHFTDYRRAALHRLADDLARLRADLERAQADRRGLDEAQLRGPLAPDEAARAGQAREHVARLRHELERIRADFERLRDGRTGPS